MSTPNTNPDGMTDKLNGAEINRMIANGEWEKVKDLLTPTEEEVMLELQKPMIDAAEVNRMLMISDEEIEETAKAPAIEGLSESKKAS